MRIAIQLLVFLVFITLMTGWFIRPDVEPPSNAIIFLDPGSDDYYSPVCLTAEQREEYERARIRQMTFPKRRNKECRDQGGFVQEGKSLTELFFLELGYGEPLESRWNEHGEWKW